MSWVELNKAAGGFSTALFSSESGNEAVGGFPAASFGIGAVQWARSRNVARNEAVGGFSTTSFGFGLFDGRVEDVATK